MGPLETVVCGARFSFVALVRVATEDLGLGSTAKGFLNFRTTGFYSITSAGAELAHQTKAA